MSDLTFLNSYCGKTIIEAFRTDFLLNGKEDLENFGSLQITFSDHSILVLEENGDAESISLSTKPIPFGDNSGYWNKIPLTNLANWQDILSRKMVSASLLVGKYGERVGLCGCRMNFENNRSFTYYNYNDNAKVVFDNDEKLEAFIAFENLSWLS